MFAVKCNGGKAYNVHVVYNGGNTLEYNSTAANTDFKYDWYPHFIVVK